MTQAPTTIQRTYKLRVYPDGAQRAQRAQRARLARWFGAERWVWNHGLERRSKAYRRRGESVSGTDVSRAVTGLKKTRRYGWLRAIPSSVLTQKLRDQDAAFGAFFAGRARYPRFKKRGGPEAVRLQIDQRQRKPRAAWECGEVFVPGLGALKSRHGAHPGQAPKMVTIRRDAAGRYFVTAMVEEAPWQRPAPRHASVGIDLGLKDLAVLSTGERIPNPRHLRRRQRRLKRAQRALARKQRGSNRWRRQRARVARLHAQVTDTRADALHKLTRRLVDETQVLCVESLNVRGLARSKLAGSVHDAAWGELLRQLTYKAAWAGREVIAVAPYTPTTRTCSACGAVTGPSGMAGLRVRHWSCTDCGCGHDRDINAAVNIRALGMTQCLPGGAGDVMRVEDGRPLATAGHAAGGWQASFETRTDQAPPTLDGTG